MKYKIGDRVRVRNDLQIGKRYPMENGGSDTFIEEMAHFRGKVVTICDCGNKYRIKEDEDGWYWTDGMFVGLAEFPKIVITTDGTETLARLYEGGKVVKTATAKCSPDDSFDAYIGAKIAFDRLLEKPKYFSGKVVCVEADERYAYTVGKIYEFKDGIVINDSGLKSSICAVKDIDEWHRHCRYAKFIPLVESEETK